MQYRIFNTTTGETQATGSLFDCHRVLLAALGNITQIAAIEQPLRISRV